MINTTVLVGRLTKDPELKYTQSGIAVTRFTLAVNRPFKNNQGQNEADFINCVAWRKQAENVANYLHRGSLVGVDGRIQTSNFEGRDGNRVFMTEVVAESVQFLESREVSQNRARSNNWQQNQNQQNAPGGYGNQGSYNNDPFAETNSAPSQPAPAPFAETQGNVPETPEVSDDDLPF